MKITTKELVLISFFAALTAIGAFIRIPLPYVPFTLQYLFCAMGAIILGKKNGMIAQLVYVGIGLIGIPVFTKGGGPQYIFEPTFGYLIGFIVGAYIIGLIMYKIKKINFVSVFISVTIGLIVIYAFGVIYLMFIENLYLGATMTIGQSILVGTVPFLPGDIFLSVIISIIAPNIIRKLNKSGIINGILD
ncbi:biotin transporter BioY [Sarcina sp. JB2]|uniref:Biotin transporter BioY n=1 Tax=Candidatus Sarcina troglodytae TaxID=2726954 RepID=A0ACD1BAV0_9CLOT|nr:biotin transporter BioY [Sarcina sp. JB2]QPJ84488.1 biotin transporter BioY [Sarcina sp. JB2]